MLRQGFAAAVAASLCLGACSSRPRAFNPVLAAAPADQSGFEAAISECTELMLAGKLDSHGRMGSGGAGAAAGATTAAVGGTAAAMAGGWGGVAVASATIVLLPFAALGGAWGMAKRKKLQKEKAVKQAMSGCLNERGYAVVDWQPASKKKSSSERRKP